MFQPLVPIYHYLLVFYTIHPICSIIAL